MRRLIFYFRQCFCKHDFQREEKVCDIESSGLFESHKVGPRISLFCKKCGYHKSFWKYL